MKIFLHFQRQYGASLNRPFPPHHSGLSLRAERWRSKEISDTKSSEISHKLAELGLNCSDNTPGKVHDYASEIVLAVEGAQAPSDTTVHMTAPANAAKDYQYAVDNTNTAFGMMSQLLANLDKLQAGDIYYVATNHVSNKFK